MKKIMVYFLLFTKRQLKQLSFIVILLIFPFFTFFFTAIGQTQDSTVRIAVFAEADEKEQAFESLVQKMLMRDGNFTFYRPESIAQLYEDVATSKAECGYIFPSDLFEQLDQNKKNKLVDVLVSPSTTLTKITNEVVYSEIFEEYSLHMLKGYLSNTIDTPDEQIDSLYRTHMTDGSTFSFAYEIKKTSAVSAKTSAEAILLSPIRGLLAVLIFLSGFCGAMNYYKDKENHIFDNRRRSSKRYLQLLSVSIPVLLASAMGLICILSAGLSQGFVKELLVMFCYAILVILFCALLCICLADKLFFCSTIPVFVIGSLIFTPVFIDMTMFLPMLKPISGLFLPYYYLLFF